MIFYYLIIINVLSFLLFGIDKYKAINKKMRIKEFHLIFITLLGGSLGALLGMIFFHHKTKKFIFISIIPIILLLQTIIVLSLK